MKSTELEAQAKDDEARIANENYPHALDDGTLEYLRQANLHDIQFYNKMVNCGPGGIMFPRGSVRDNVKPLTQ